MQLSNSPILEQMMPLKNTDTNETIKRLRNHPVVCMDKQNITGDAADELERLREFIESVTLANGPYQDLNGHRIVGDAYKILSGDGTQDWRMKMAKEIDEIIELARRDISDEGVFTPDQIGCLRAMLDEIEKAVTRAAQCGPTPLSEMRY